MIKVAFVIGDYPLEQLRLREDVAKSYSSADVAAQVGEHFGVVCYHPSAMPRHRAQCIAYGMENFIAGRRASGFYVQHIAANKDKMIESFLMAAHALIDEDGADVIIPQGITQCPVQMKPQWLSEQLGVPVVEGIGAPIRVAALLAGLGLKQSRVRWQKQGSQP